MQGTILIVDNDQHFTQAVQSALQNHGVRSTICEDTNVDQIKSLRPAVIMLNAELPRTSGFSLCVRIKKEPELKTTPIVLVSNNATDDAFDQHAQRPERANLYLHKPLTPQYAATSLIELMASSPPPLTKTGEVSKLTTNTTTASAGPIGTWPQQYFDRQVREGSVVNAEEEKQIAHDPIELLRFRLKRFENRDQNYRSLCQQMQDRGVELAAQYNELERLYNDNANQLTEQREVAEHLQKQLSETEENFRDFHTKVTEIFNQKDQEEQNLCAELEQHKNQVAQLKQDLKATTDHRKTDQAIANALQDELDSLRTSYTEEKQKYTNDKEQLLEQLETQSKLTEGQQQQIERLNSQRHELEVKVNNQQSILGQSYERAENLKKELEEKEYQIRTIQQDSDNTFRTLRDEIELLQKEYEQINNSHDQEIQLLRSNLQQSHEKNEELTIELEQIFNEKKQQQKDKQFLEDKLLQLDKEFTQASRDAQNEQNRLYAELEQLRAEYAALSDQALDQEIQFSAEIDKTRTEHAIAQQELLVQLHAAKDKETQQENDLVKIQNEAEELKNQVENLSQQLKTTTQSLNQQVKKYREDLSKEQKARSNAEQLHAQTITTIQQQNTQLEELKTALDVTLDQQQSSNSQVADAHQQIFELREELNQAKEKLAVSDNGTYELSTTPFNPALGADVLQMQTLQATVDDQNRALAEAHRTIDELRIEFSRNQRDIRQLEANLSAAEQARLAAEKQRNILQKEIDRIKFDNPSSEELLQAREQIANLSKLLQQQEALLLDSNVDLDLHNREEITLVPDMENIDDPNGKPAAPILTLEQIESEGLNFSSFDPSYHRNLIPAEEDVEEYHPYVDIPSQSDLISAPSPTDNDNSYETSPMPKPRKKTPSNIKGIIRDIRGEISEDDDATVLLDLRQNR